MFVRDGVVEFLPDCDHELAGQKVTMTPELADPFGRAVGVTSVHGLSESG